MLQLSSPPKREIDSRSALEVSAKDMISFNKTSYEQSSVVKVNDIKGHIMSVPDAR